MTAAAAGLVAGSLVAPPRAAATEPRSTVVEPAVPYAAKPLPLADVRLTDGPLAVAQQRDHEYLLELEPDRMLSYLRERAGLEPKAEPYGGWDGEGRQLTGHIAGHYLSAVSYMYQATGDEELKRRLDYVVDELAAVQDGRGTGYIGALLGNDRRRGNSSGALATDDLVDGEQLFARLKEGRIESGGFDLNGMWAPWYVQHKLFAGLRDAYRLGGSEKALEVEKGLAQWAHDTVGGLTHEQAQQMLRTEFGGMNEVLVDLYADTGDEKWLELSKQFEDDSFVEPLAAGDNILPGKHGNTQVPKLVGSLERYRYTGDQQAGDAARNFWDFVVHDHSFATGGHGYDEYFGPADQLSGQIDGTGQRSRSMRTAESCNVYNMLKLTRGLFSVEPSIEYADFLERALFNHVLASIHPETGQTTYMVPVGPGVTHEYGDMFHSFTCCVGSGMESHALHGDGLYFADGAEQLWVTTYAASKAEWKQAGTLLTLDTQMPVGDTATLSMSMNEPHAFTLSLRRPAWAGDDFSIAVNGEAVADLGEPGSFVDVEREWSPGDRVEVTLPHALRVERLEDNENRVAIFYGPVVLAGDFGDRDERREQIERFPVFAHADKALDEWLEPVDGEAGSYTATLADGREMKLSPFYQEYGRRYGLYWDLFTPEQWSAKQAEYEAEEAERQRIANATIAFVQVGEMQPERDFKFEDAGTTAFRDHGQPGRRGGQWMSVEIPVEQGETPVALTLSTSPQAAEEDVVVTYNGVELASPERTGEPSGNVVDFVYAISPDAASDGEAVVVRLSAREGGELPPIFGIRVVRDEAASESTAE